MNCLPDINVWLALTFSAHPHHGTAAAWFQELEPGSTCAFCRMTQQGFLRLSSNPRAFASDSLSLPEAWNAFDTLISDARVTYEDEPPAVEAEWRRLTGEESFSPKIWNDAFLAAFARTAALELVTFDRGFRRYQDLSLRLLQA